MLQLAPGMATGERGLVPKPHPLYRMRAVANRLRLPPATDLDPGVWWQPERRRLPFGLGGARRPLLSLLIAVAIPVLLFGGWVTYLSAQDERRQAQEAAAKTADRVADRVSADIATQLQVAQALAASTALDRPSLGAFYEEAQRVKAAHPLWQTVELADPSGVQVLNLLRPPDTPLGPTADQESFAKVVLTKEPAVGGIGPVGAISGRRLVALRVPVLRAGELRYVLSVALAPDGVGSILRSAGAPISWIGAVVDADGRIIARTLAGEIEQGRPASLAVRQAIADAPAGFYRGRTLEGIEVDTVYRTLPGTAGWSVHFGMASAALNAPVQRSQYLLASGGLASLLLAAGLASLTARDIAQRRRDEAARSAAALKLSEERRAVALEAASLGTWRWEVDRDLVLCCERSRELLGLPLPARGEFGWPSSKVMRSIHPHDRSALLRALRQGLADDEPLDVEFRAVRRDGTARWLRATGRTQDRAGTRARLIHGVLADIEPRKRAEAERLELLRRLGQAQEDERRRIARELHDQVGQTVTGLSLGLKGLEQLLADGRDFAAARASVHWLQSLTTEIGRDIHRAASDLRPTALDDLGLDEALLAYASEWGARNGVAVDVQMVGADTRLPAEIETTAYRIIQEALTNVLKHAAASNVSVLLARKPGQLRIIVEDDGVGFDPETVQGGPAPDEAGRIRARLGLSGIRERLALVGGTMTLESAPEAGTTLFIQIPVAAEGQA
jgi:two-component system sensor histidine kinase UhpB